MSAKVTEHIINFDELDKLKLDVGIDHVFWTSGQQLKRPEQKKTFGK